MRSRRRPLTRIERVLLAVLGCLITVWGVEASLTWLYLEPRNQLRAEVETLASNLHRTRRLEARAAEIQRQYEQLQAGGEEHAAPKRSESDILLEIEKLAREGVRLHSLQPRPGVVEGASTLHLSLEASSDLPALAAFLESAVGQLGAEVTALTLTPDATPEGASAIRSRIELDVVYDGS